MKHIYRVGVFGILIVVLVLTGELKIESSWSSSRSETLTSTALDLESLRNITGVWLEGPQVDTQDRWISIMNNNTDYLYGWIYDITNPRMIDRLQEQSLSHPVRIILEDQKYMQFGDDFGKTAAAFTTGDIVLYADKDLDVVYTHAKSFVGEDRRVIQTANFNTTSWRDNREHFFLSQDEVIRQDLLKLFALDLSRITNSGDSYTQDYESLKHSFSPELVVCPLNCREKIETLLNHAQERIWISTQYILDSAILNILKAKHHQGIDIRILSNKLESNRDLLRVLGSENIRFDTHIYNHDKLTLVDNIVLMGSMNMSDNSLDNNREIGIILTDPSIVDAVETLFDH